MTPSKLRRGAVIAVMASLPWAPGRSVASSPRHRAGIGDGADIGLGGHTGPAAHRARSAGGQPGRVLPCGVVLGGDLLRGRRAIYSGIRTGHAAGRTCQRHMERHGGAASRQCARRQQQRGISVSCPTDGSCVAIGTYDEHLGRVGQLHRHASSVVRGQPWRLRCPPTRSRRSADTFLKSIDCTSVGSCTTFGAYKNAHGSGHPVGFFDTLAAGAWTPQVAPQPAGADAQQSVIPASLSCPSSGPCAAAATYTNADSNSQAELLTRSASGAWSAQDSAPSTNTGTGTNESSDLFGVSSFTGVWSPVAL